MNLNLVTVIGHLSETGKTELWTAIMDAASAEHDAETKARENLNDAGHGPAYHKQRKHELWDAADYVRVNTPSLGKALSGWSTGA